MPLDRLVDIARQRGHARVTLHATPQAHTEMRLEFHPDRPGVP